MNSVLLSLVVSVIVGVTHGDKLNAVLEDVIKGQLKVIEHCVGVTRYRHVNTFHRHRRGTTVAFYARASTNLQNLAARQNVVFNIAEVNEGGGYDKSDGTFTAPVDGLYVFHWTIVAQRRKTFATELLVNGSVKGMNHAFARSLPEQMPASQVVIVKMKKYEKARLRVHLNYGSFMYGGHWSSFSGYLLTGQVY